MAKFQIYTYLFRPVTEHQTDIPFKEFQKIDVQDSFDRKQDLTNDVLSDNKRLKFKFNNVVYAHKMYIGRDGIYALRIANTVHKPTKYETDFKVMKQDNHPSCIAIIDNRKDRQIIAIEQNSAFGKDPSLAVIIQTTLRKALQHHRLTLDVTPKFHTSDFWQVVDTSMMLKGIEYVDFPFAYPNLPEISDMVGEYMNNIARQTNSEPTLKLKGQNNESVNLSREDQWLLSAIKACAASGRPIIIKPKGAELRKIGVDSPVYEEISDETLTELDQKELFDSKYNIIVEFLNTIKIVYD